MIFDINNQEQYDIVGIIDYFDWIYAHKNDIDKSEPEAQKCLKAHLKKGIKQVLWSVGRGVVYFDAKDPGITRYGTQSNKEQMRSADIDFLNELDKGCPLSCAIEFAHNNGITIIGDLCMNRHYGGTMGNCMTPLVARNPENWEINKDGTQDKTRLCFALDEYCEERLAIIKEIVEMGVDGVNLDFVRQPPMLRYHPFMVKEYIKETGLDPLTINVNIGSSAQDLEKFMDWCQFRSSFLTEFIKKVRRYLREYELKSNRIVPLSVRITDDGFTGNILSGIDIVKWCNEKLVDCVIPFPLQWVHGLWTHDVAPYVKLGKKTGVEIIGGVCTNTVQGYLMNPVCVAKRIKNAYDAGVSGTAIFESNGAVDQPEMQEILEVIHEYEALDSMLKNKAYLKRHPINGLNANAGMDNHSGSQRELLSTI